MFERIARQSLDEAVASGAFDNLEGTGLPFRYDPASQPVGERWAGFRILQNGGLLPEWLELGREIERDMAALAELDRRHGDTVMLAKGAATPAKILRSAALVREHYRMAAEQLRRKQDRFNVMAPSVHCERPGIWVEHEIARLDASARAVERAMLAGEEDEACPGH